MKTNEIATVLVGTLVLAGLAVTVYNGGNSARVIGAGASGWADIIRAAAYGK